MLKVNVKTSFCQALKIFIQKQNNTLALKALPLLLTWVAIARAGITFVPVA